VGQYRLDLTVDKSRWRAGEFVTGTATLSNTGSAPVTISGSSERIAFAYDEVGRARTIGPA